MLEHYLFLGLLGGIGALLVCCVLYWIFKRFDNPFDNLDESDLEEFDRVTEVIINLTGSHSSSVSLPTEHKKHD